MDRFVQWSVSDAPCRTLPRRAKIRGRLTGALSRVVLIVEDDEAIGTLILEAINDEPGYQATLAADGAVALLAIKGAPQVDLFLLDIGLPGMTGIELYDLIRAEERFRRTSVLFVSASAGEHAQALADRQIATFLPKPFALAALLDLVRSLAPVVVSPA